MKVDLGDAEMNKHDSFLKVYSFKDIYISHITCKVRNSLFDYYCWLVAFSILLKLIKVKVY